jgi:hypothetical protein
LISFLYILVVRWPTTRLQISRAADGFYWIIEERNAAIFFSCSHFWERVEISGQTEAVIAKAWFRRLSIRTLGWRQAGRSLRALSKCIIQSGLLGTIMMRVLGSC